MVMVRKERRKRGRSKEGSVSTSRLSLTRCIAVPRTQAVGAPPETYLGYSLVVGPSGRLSRGSDYAKQHDGDRDKAGGDDDEAPRCRSAAHGED